MFFLFLSIYLSIFFFSFSKRFLFYSSQDFRVNAALKTKYGEDVVDQTVTVCSGLDFVNISLCHFVFEDQETAEVNNHHRRRKSFSF